MDMVLLMWDWGNLPNISTKGLRVQWVPDISTKGLRVQWVLGSKEHTAHVPTASVAGSRGREALSICTWSGPL